MSTINCFPETRYMGSKRLLLPQILSEVRKLAPTRVLDPFSGSGCVSYGMKTLGVTVHANDFMKFASNIAFATVRNNGTVLSDADVSMLVRRNPSADDFIQRTFGNRYFSDVDNSFLDNLWANLSELKSKTKRSLALAAACRAAMKKRPRGIFTFTGMKGWDGRRDLRLSMEEQFRLAIAEFNRAIFSNRQRNQVFCADVFALDPTGYDLVYIDTPYISPFSDSDYTRRYHFVEGYCSYWKDVEIMSETSTKKIRSYNTAFSTRAAATTAFERLFEHFRRSTLVVSYSSNSIPNKQAMIKILKSTKKRVRVVEIQHRYSFGNRGAMLDRSSNSVTEYLFVAR